MPYTVNMAKKKTARKKKKATAKSSPRKKAIQARWNEFLNAVKPEAAKAGMTAIEFVEKLITANLQTAKEKYKAAFERQMRPKKTTGRQAKS